MNYSLSKKTAIISDVHSNLEALVAVVKNAKLNGVEQFINLGDFVGYGGKSVECMQILIDLKSLNVLGNHESMLINPPILST
jgi:predicted phosphodiesterase